MLHWPSEREEIVLSHHFPPRLSERLRLGSLESPNALPIRRQLRPKKPPNPLAKCPYSSAFEFRQCSCTRWCLFYAFHQWDGERGVKPVPPRAADSSAARSADL